jgi:hypothetical protein
LAPTSGYIPGVGKISPALAPAEASAFGREFPADGQAIREIVIPSANANWPREIKPARGTWRASNPLDGARAIDPSPALAGEGTPGDRDILPVTPMPGSAPGPPLTPSLCAIDSFSTAPIETSRLAIDGALPTVTAAAPGANGSA